MDPNADSHIPLDSNFQVGLDGSFFLERLTRLVELEQDTPRTSLSVHYPICLAQVSTYQDLRRLGFQREAREILRRSAS